VLAGAGPLSPPTSAAAGEPQAVGLDRLSSRPPSSG